MPKSPFLDDPAAPESLEPPPVPPEESQETRGIRSSVLLPRKATAGYRRQPYVPSRIGRSHHTSTNVAPALRSIRQSLMKVSQSPQTAGGEGLTLRAQTPQGNDHEIISPFVTIPSRGASQPVVVQTSATESVGSDAPLQTDAAGRSAESELKALPALIKFRIPENPLRAK